MIASHGGINWCWYLDYEIKDGKVFINRHYRIHRSSASPNCTETFMLLEKGEDDYGNLVHEVAGRIVDRAVINGLVYLVINQKNIFSYDTEPVKTDFTVEEILQYEPCYTQGTIESCFAGRQMMSLLNICDCEKVPEYDRIWILIRLLYKQSSILENAISHMGLEYKKWMDEEDITVDLSQRRMDLADSDGVHSTILYQQRQLQEIRKCIISSTTTTE